MTFNAAMLNCFAQPGAADWSVVPDLPAAVDHILGALDPRI
ncbi:MAG: hypothetical protein ABSF26_02995 [Thermoguttaceae bacterium]